MFDPILVHNYLSFSAKKFPDKEALIFGNERWTYKIMDQYTDHLANTLVDFGLKRHDRVIVFLDNSSESVISLYGIIKAGGVFVILNGSIKAQKLRYILDDSGAAFLITHTKKANVVRSAIEDRKQPCKIIWIGNSQNIPEKLSSYSYLWHEIFDNPPSIQDNALKKKTVQIIDQDLATLIYTSGSTGEPKGVITPHFNMISAARSIIQYLENTSNDIILNVLPLSFDYGLYQVIMTFMFGGTIILEPSFMFPVKFLQCIETEQVTGFPIVPTIIALLLNIQNLSKYNFNSLRYITNTGAALPVEHIFKLKKIFSHVKIYSMYGLTECKRVSYLHPDKLERYPTSVGKAIPNCEVFIVDEQGREVPSGEVGELVVRGSNVMKGYWNETKLTKKTFRNGHFPGEKFLYTGDLFRIDQEGFLYFVGRRTDMIKTKGQRVSPKEIENILCQAPGILEAAVIGVPDDILGQAIKAYIVSKPSNKLTEKEILKHCSENLELFAMPKYIEFVDILPKTPNGKIDKKYLLSIN